MVESLDAMKLFSEAVTEAQLSAARRLGPLAQKRGFYLAGGTAGALFLGHRLSVDLDFFVPAGLGDPLDLAEELQAAGTGFAVTQTAPGTLHGEVTGVPVSFVEFRYSTLERTRAWPAAGCQLASLDDFAAMKLSAVAHRGHRKDFYDVYALGTKHRPIAGLLDCYRRRFEIKDPGHVLIGLTYFDDADRQTDPRLLWPLDWEAVKETIGGWVKKYVDEVAN